MPWLGPGYGEPRRGLRTHRAEARPRRATGKRGEGCAGHASAELRAHAMGAGPSPRPRRAARRPAAREGNRGREGKGGEGGGAHRGTGAEQTGATAAISGGESFVERRQRNARRGEREMNRGDFEKLTGGPHRMAAVGQPPCPHRPGERAAPTRWRLGRRAGRKRGGKGAGRGS
jgi:hypothetical protein